MAEGHGPCFQEGEACLISRPQRAFPLSCRFTTKKPTSLNCMAVCKASWRSLSRSYQFVFVDDGSTDLTYKLLKEVALIDPHVTVIKLRRNFGQTGALAAGFHSTGDYVIAMDGDLQHDPAEIPGFLEKIEEGYDVVSGWRSHRIDNLLLRKIPSRCANWLMAKLSGVDIHDFGTTFKAYRGDLLRQLPLYGEMHRFIPAMASFYGASICEIPIQNNHRKHGESHYNISRTFRVFFDLMTIRFLLRYMSRPLHFFGRLGAINMGLGSAHRTLALDLESSLPESMFCSNTGYCWCLRPF